MMPWPKGNNDPEEEFYNNQRDMLSRRYRHLIDNFRDKYIVLFNQIIPIPEEELEQSGADYTEARSEERYNAMEHVLASPRSRELFLSSMEEQWNEHPCVPVQLRSLPPEEQLKRVN